MRGWFAVLVVLGACNTSSKPGAATPGPAGPAMAGSAASAPAPAGELVAREAGVGPLNDDVELSAKAIAALLPGYEVEAVSIPMGEGDLADEHVAVRKRGKLLLKVWGMGALQHVTIVSDDVRHPFGVKLGMTFAEAEQRLGKLWCEDAGDHTDWNADVAECGFEQSKRFRLEFTLDGSDAAELLADPALRAQAKLIALQWTAPGLGPPGTE